MRGSYYTWGFVSRRRASMVISAHIATDAIKELRVRVRLLSTTAEGQRVTCQVGACNAGCTARPATPSASCNCKHCCLVLSWKAVAPRMCKPWNNLFAAASFIDSICIRNAVLLPSQSLVNQHPCNIETESETETHTPLHRQKESTREASF